jgi:hypothetical protein
VANAPLRAENLKTILPDSDYVGTTPTLPMGFGAILQQNRHIPSWHPNHGAEAFQQRAKARYGVWWIVLVVQQTLGGFLNFIPHVHL